MITMDAKWCFLAKCWFSLITIATSQSIAETNSLPILATDMTFTTSNFANQSTTNIMDLFAKDENEGNDNFNDTISGSGLGDETTTPSGVDSTTSIMTTVIETDSTTNDDLDGSGISTASAITDETTANIAETDETTFFANTTEESLSNTTQTTIEETTSIDSLTDLFTTPFTEGSGDTSSTIIISTTDANSIALTTESDITLSVPLTSAVASTNKQSTDNVQTTDSVSITITSETSSVTATSEVDIDGSGDIFTSDFFSTTEQTATNSLGTTAAPATFTSVQSTLGETTVIAEGTSPAISNVSTTDAQTSSSFLVSTPGQDTTTFILTDPITDEATDGSADIFPSTTADAFISSVPTSDSTINTESTTSAFTEETSQAATSNPTSGTTAIVSDLTTTEIFFTDATDGIGSGFTDSSAENASTTSGPTTETFLNTTFFVTSIDETTADNITNGDLSTTDLRSVVTSSTDGSGDLLESTAAITITQAQTTSDNLESSVTSQMTSAPVILTTMEVNTGATENNVTASGSSPLLTSSSLLETTTEALEEFFTTRDVITTRETLTTGEVLTVEDTSTTRNTMTTGITLTSDVTLATENILTTVESFKTTNSSTIEVTPKTDETFSTEESSTIEETSIIGDTVTTRKTLTTGNVLTTVETSSETDTLTTGETLTTGAIPTAEDTTITPNILTTENTPTTGDILTTEETPTTEDTLTTGETLTTGDTLTAGDRTTRNTLTTGETLTTGITPTTGDTTTTANILTTKKTPTTGNILTTGETLTTADILTTRSTPITGETLTTGATPIAGDTTTTTTGDTLTTSTIRETPTTIETLTTEVTPVTAEATMSQDTSTASETSTTGAGSTTGATTTTPVVTSDSIAYIELDLESGSTATSDDLAQGLSLAYAEIVQDIVRVGRKKRAASAVTTINNITYNVTITRFNVNGRINASFYVIEKVDGNISIPSGAFVAGSLRNNLQTVLQALSMNNINATSAIIVKDGVCQEKSELVAIDLHLINTTSSLLVDFTQSEVFLAQITSGLDFLYSWNGLSTCAGTSNIPNNYEICGVFTQSNCSVTVSFIENNTAATAASTIDRLMQITNDLQVYGVALKAYALRLPYVFNTPDIPVSTDPDTTEDGTITPVSLPSWCLPVVITLGVICILLMIIVVILFYLHYCRRKGDKEPAISTLRYRKISSKEEVTQTPAFNSEKLTSGAPRRQRSQSQHLRKRMEPQPVPEPHYVSEEIRKRAPPMPATLTESDDMISTTRRRHTKKKPKPVSMRESPVVDPSDALFEPVAFLSSDPVHSKPSKFQTTILPIYLPPIQTQLVSEQLRRNISDSPDNRSPQNTTRNGSVHTFDPGADEETARVYRDAQQNVDDALEPKQPSVFDMPQRKRIRNRRGKADIAQPLRADPDLEALMGDSKLGNYYPTSPKQTPAATETPPSKSTPLSPESARMKIASLLNDAFSLVSPKSTINPMLSSQDSVAPQQLERDASVPPGSGKTNLTSTTNDPLFTKVQPPQIAGGAPLSYYLPASETPSGEPAYITPVKKVSDPLGGKSGVWTPYRAFDEISKIRDELENPIFPLGHHPHSAPSPFGNPKFAPPRQRTSSGGVDKTDRPTSLIDDAANSDNESNLKSSAASLIKGIKEEISRLANISTPVRSLSPSSQKSSPRDLNDPR